MPIHVDTTLQIERFKTPVRADRVNRALGKFPFQSTSTYARYEFNRTLLRDLAYLYARCQKATQLGDIIGALNHAFGGRLASKNRLTRCLEVIQAFLDVRPRGTAISPEVELIRLREHIAFGLTQAHLVWERSVTHHYDGTSCVRSREVPTRAANESIIFSLSNCKPTKIQCRVHQFFEDNKTHFVTIATHLKAAGDSASPQMQKALREIDSALVNPTRLCDNANCAKLGDAIIAVDGMA